jgi:hypothetical protein
LLRDRIEILLPDALVLAEEFGDWEESGRRIDLLCLGRDGALIVVELKRGTTGSHMELQALRYASMVSAMTFDQAVEAHAAFLRRHGRDGDARTRLLDFLGWEEPDGSEFAHDVRLVLVSEDFGKELTTAVLWLNERELDITCVRIVSYEHAGEHLVQLEQIIPLPEAADYQSRLREKVQEVRRTQAQQREPARELIAAVEAYDAIATDDLKTSGRAWNYRQIRPPEWNDPIGAHYEFLYATGKCVGAEFHIERARTRPVAEVLRPLAGEILSDSPVALEWDPNWANGKGRLTCRLPLETSPQVVARTMISLIERTRSIITRRLEELQARNGAGDE